MLTRLLPAAALLLVGASPVCAQRADGNGNGHANGYPSRPVRIIVPLAPGGGSDIVARLGAPALIERWKQTVVIDNRAGAGSVIGTAIAAKAPADGHTLLVSSSSIAITPALYKDTGFDIVRDFEGISMLASQPSILAVHPSVPAASVRDLVGLLKSKPGQFRYGSAGQGSASHLSNELFRSAAGADVTHIPYKSAGLATTALLSGEVQLMVTNMATILPQVRAGKVKGLAVTSAQRSAMAPDLPTVSEAGLPGYEYTTWYAMLAPAGTPKPLVAGIHRDLAALAQTPAVRERFASQGLDFVATPPAEFNAYLKTEIAKWGKVVREAGVKPE
jgi:tripartite-type tricarboxylate transporter receptor subunit TctC